MRLVVLIQNEAADITDVYRVWVLRVGTMERMSYIIARVMFAGPTASMCAQPGVKMSFYK